MTGKRIWNEWNLTTLALGGVCLGTFFVRARAWHAGHAANALGLLGCHLLRAILLALGWVMVVVVLKAAARKEKPTAPTKLTFLETVSALLLVPGCVGCYPVWPMVLALLTAQMVLTPLFRPADDRPARTDLVRAGVAVLLFTLAWYVAASTTRQALRGLGERIEAMGGSDRLKVWATDVLAASRRRQQARPAMVVTVAALAASPPGYGPLLAAAATGSGGSLASPYWLDPAEIPDWVEDLLGPFQGVRSVGVQDYAEKGCVVLYTGGSAYHFRIMVCPSGIERGPLARWFDGDESEWRPGIYLGTEGK